MNLSVVLARCFFIFICVGLFAMYSADGTPFSYLIGSSLGLAFGSLLCLFEIYTKKFHLQWFNIACLGLFFGYLMGQVLILTLGSVHPLDSPFIKLMIFLTTSYFGIALTAKAATNFQLCIPFIQLQPQGKKRKDLLLDRSILTDPRIIDLANSGLLDGQVIMPTFAVKELEVAALSGDDATRHKAKKSLENLQKIEGISSLELQFTDRDYPEIKDDNAKLTKLAKALHANILTADISKVLQTEAHGPKWINVNFLSQALKPLTTTGELLSIKIQRYGKEPRQGVGYLDDGTMVVVNGAADFIGETIKAVVLSVKHTSSGRMIFCNTEESPLFDSPYQDLEYQPQSYS